MKYIFASFVLFFCCANFTSIRSTIQDDAQYWYTHYAKSLSDKEKNLVAQFLYYRILQSDILHELYTEKPTMEAPGTDQKISPSEARKVLQVVIEDQCFHKKNPAGVRKAIRWLQTYHKKAANVYTANIQNRMAGLAPKEAIARITNDYKEAKLCFYQQIYNELTDKSAEITRYKHTLTLPAPATLEKYY